MHEGQAFFFLQLGGVGQGVVEAVAVQHHLAAALAHGFHLDLRGGARHHDHRAHAHGAGRQGQALGVVAGGRADHAAGALLVAEAGQLVVGATQLEGEHRLQILALEQHAVADASGDQRGRMDGRFQRHVVDAGLENPFYVLIKHRRHGRSARVKPLVYGARGGSVHCAVLYRRAKRPYNRRTLASRRPTMDQNALKKQVAEAALRYVPEGEVVGVGTGSTANFFIDGLAGMKDRIAGAVASSEATAERLRGHGIPVLALNDVDRLPVYVDGADEVNEHREMIKGGGGALTREKIVAAVAKDFICIVDGSKKVKRLGAFPLPVEVIPMARSYVARKLVGLGGRPEYREGFVTDNGNIILDVHNLDIVNPLELEKTLNNITGVVTNGLFALRPADVVLVGEGGGVSVY